MTHEIKSDPIPAEMESPVLNSISLIYEKKENLFRNSLILTEISPEIKTVASFFKIETKTAAAMAVLICNQLMGESASMQRVMKSLGLSPLDYMRVNNSFIDFRKIGWMKISSRNMVFGDEKIEYEFSKEVIDAVLKNDPAKLQMASPENLTDALLQIQRLISDLQDVLIDEDHRLELLIVLERYEQFPLIGKLLSDNNLTSIEKLILLLYCADSLFGKDEFDLNNTIEMFSDNPSEAFYTRNRIKEEKMAILRDGYIRYANQDLVDFAAVVLGDRILNDIDAGSFQMEDNKLSLKFCKLIQPAEIAQRTLFFNSDTRSAIQDIMKFTSPENFANLHKRLLKNGMNPGLTMMFYGPPGTGKTELVMQIARMHQLPILQVDIGKIKNMWVGESEKNLNRVFDEYKSAFDHFKNTPILLFNEADGILGVRKNVKSSVDQMLNSMQNILLQKLESFSGIFIATTNLTNNIDSAFDRRMLYKQRFDLPDANTRFSILKSIFPDFSMKLLQDISSKYNLSGGQIQNIRKKFVVDDILYEEKHNITENMLRYIEEETRFRSRNQTAIGYKFSNQNHSKIKKEAPFLE